MILYTDTFISAAVGSSAQTPHAYTDTNARSARSAELYNTNFPRKKPMKMAAMTTSSDGSDLEAGSLLSIDDEDLDTELSN